jgi:dipeptidyl aminopeptidase/acylaminoacyl peptidase
MGTERVHFYSEGARLAGILYLPEGASGEERKPGIVLCHGFTGIKELILSQYAGAFAEAGLIALTFDYRGFGESDGQRGRLLWNEQVEDIRNAITYLSTREEVDPQRIGLWGTSYGGALAPYTLAVDDRVKACVGQLGFGDGATALEEGLPVGHLEALRPMIEEDRRRRVLHNDPMYGDAMALTGDPEMTAYMQKVARQLPQLEGREILLQFLEAHLQFSPMSVIHKKGNRPLLLIAAEEDVICPVENYKRLYDEAPEPKEWVVFEKTRHFEFYDGEPALRSAAEAVRFFQKHLGGC